DSLAQPEERSRIEHLRLAVQGEPCHQTRHRTRVGAVAVGLGAVAVEDVDRVEIAALPARGCLGAPGVRRWPQTPEDRARSVRVLLVPEGMGVRQRLAPI